MSFIEARIRYQQVMTLEFVSITLQNSLWSLYVSQGDTRLCLCAPTHDCPAIFQSVSWQKPALNSGDSHLQGEY
jgi:hypothetical protein